MPFPKSFTFSETSSASARRPWFLLLFTFYLLPFTSSAQVRMRDVFAQLPDSVLPYMTRNNRLDCIDFIENGIEARVKNRFSEHVTLDTLTEDFLSMHTSTSSYVEMKLVPHAGDTAICVNRTYMGSTADSDVRLYSMDWTLISRLPRPAVSDFLVLPVDQTTKQLSPDTMQVIRQEAEYLPLMKATLSTASNDITWTLQTTELSKEYKKVAGKYLQPVIKSIR